MFRFLLTGLLLASLPLPLAAQDFHTAAAKHMLDVFVEGCLKRISDPDSAIDWAITQLDFEPAPDDVAGKLLASGQGLAWIDENSTGAMSFAVSTTTYHCAVASDGLNSDVAWSHFAALILKLEEGWSGQSDLSAVQIPATTEGASALTQTFAVFPRQDGYETTLDVTRPTDPSESGPVRFAATISKAD